MQLAICDMCKRPERVSGCDDLYLQPNQTLLALEQVTVDIVNVDNL